MSTVAVYAVIAGTQEEADKWASEHNVPKEKYVFVEGLQPEEPQQEGSVELVEEQKDWRRLAYFVHEVKAANKVIGVVTTGTFHNRSDINEVRRALEATDANWGTSYADTFNREFVTKLGAEAAAASAVEEPEPDPAPAPAGE